MAGEGTDVTGQTMKFVTDYRLLAKMIDGPYNAPTVATETDLAQFESEYNSVRDRLVDILQTFGVVSPYGDGDFSVGHYTAPSRGISVVIDSPAQFSPAIIHSLKSFADSLPQNYVIVISGEHDLGEDFYICMPTGGEVVGTAARKEWLRPFEEPGYGHCCPK